MHYTNLHNLPQPLFDALTFDDYEMGDADISVTGLIKPPRIRILEKRHDDEIVQDCTERLWAVLGSIGHKIIERHEPDRGFSEERLYLDIGGWKVGAKPDLWHEPHTIQDYKYTTIWSYIFGLKDEWIQQLNMYAPFYRESGFEVKQLDIVAIFRDHQISKQKMDPNYPCQVEVMKVPLWRDEEQVAFLYKRTNAHQMAEGFEDDKLPLCTPEERWERPTVYAVKKIGNKRSTKNFESEEEAVKFLKEKGDKFEMETRVGESVRCNSYCNVKNFCSQFKEINHENI